MAKEVYRQKTKMFFSVITKGLRQSLAAESPLKMMKNAFYFNSQDT